LVPQRRGRCLRPYVRGTCQGHGTNPPGANLGLWGRGTGTGGFHHGPLPGGACRFATRRPLPCRRGRTRDQRSLRGGGAGEREAAGHTRGPVECEWGGRRIWPPHRDEWGEDRGEFADRFEAGRETDRVRLYLQRGRGGLGGGAGTAGMRRLVLSLPRSLRPLSLSTLPSRMRGRRKIVGV
ncbi:hypothetical protein NGA_2037700, partial [Nannochloropsis gaditana CCMP526]|uniref:uncharacterized protein n=1 Tax=Nannochloropsis gaditana (strain CCMP526) TaxID=1093141 RepID=UPI00029F6B6A